MIKHGNSISIFNIFTQFASNLEFKGKVMFFTIHSKQYLIVGIDENTFENKKIQIVRVDLSHYMTTCKNVNFIVKKWTQNVKMPQDILKFISDFVL